MISIQCASTLCQVIVTIINSGEAMNCFFMDNFTNILATMAIVVLMGKKYSYSQFYVSVKRVYRWQYKAGNELLKTIISCVLSIHCLSSILTLLIYFHDILIEFENNLEGEVLAHFLNYNTHIPKCVMDMLKSIIKKSIQSSIKLNINVM